MLLISGYLNMPVNKCFGFCSWHIWDFAAGSNSHCSHLCVNHSCLQYRTCVERWVASLLKLSVKHLFLCSQVHVLHQHARSSSQDWACSPWWHRERSAFYNWVDPTSSTGDWQQTWKAFLGGCRSEAHRKLWLVRYVAAVKCLEQSVCMYRTIFPLWCWPQ